MQHNGITDVPAGLTYRPGSLLVDPSLKNSIVCIAMGGMQLSAGSWEIIYTEWLRRRAEGNLEPLLPDEVAALLKAQE